MKGPLKNFAQRFRLCIISILIQHDQKTRKPLENIVCMHFYGFSRLCPTLKGKEGEPFIYENYRHTHFYASINSKREHPPGQPRGFAPIFSPDPGDFYHLNCLGVGPIIKIPSCQLMPHEGTFQLQTDLPSIAALWLQNLFQS